MKRVLVTGASGFLGGHVRARLAETSHEVVILAGRDIDADRVASIAPHAVVHLAALTNADVCEVEPERAHDVNVELTRQLAEGASPSCTTFLYASTDLVFDGARGHYREDDDARPICGYGKTKLDGERVARSVLGDRCVIARLALMYGPRRHVDARPSFAETMVRHASRGEPVTLFQDQYRSPLHVEDASESLVRLIGLAPRVTPILHLGGPERLSRYDMGRIAFDALGLPAALARAGRMSGHAGAAPRPEDVSLDISCARAFGLPARGFAQGIAEFRDRMGEPWLQ